MFSCGGWSPVRKEMVMDTHTCPARLWPQCPTCESGPSREAEVALEAWKRIEWASHGHDYDNPADDWHLL